MLWCFCPINYVVINSSVIIPGSSNLPTSTFFRDVREVLEAARFFRRNRRLEPPERDGKILNNHRQNGNVAACIVITYSRVWTNRGRLPILLVVS